jgi:hypothetical protein
MDRSSQAELTLVKDPSNDNLFVSKKRFSLEPQEGHEFAKAFVEFLVVNEQAVFNNDTGKYELHPSIAPMPKLTEITIRNTSTNSRTTIPIEQFGFERLTNGYVSMFLPPETFRALVEREMVQAAGLYTDQIPDFQVEMPEEIRSFMPTNIYRDHKGRYSLQYYPDNWSSVAHTKLAQLGLPDKSFSGAKEPSYKPEATLRAPLSPFDKITARITEKGKPSYIKELPPTAINWHWADQGNGMDEGFSLSVDRLALGASPNAVVELLPDKGVANFPISLTQQYDAESMVYACSDADALAGLEYLKMLGVKRQDSLEEGTGLQRSGDDRVVVNVTYRTNGRERTDEFWLSPDLVSAPEGHEGVVKINYTPLKEALALATGAEIKI